MEDKFLIVDHQVFLFHLRRARRKAMPVAIAEAMVLLEDLSPQTLKGGPLGEKPDLFSIAVPSDFDGRAMARFPNLGYSQSVDAIQFDVTGRRGREKRHITGSQPTWKGKPIRLERVYEEDPASVLELHPDRREFMLPGPDGKLKIVKGYRGDGAPGNQRALPLADCRALVNLVNLPNGGRFLDPFAGAGGIVAEALARDWKVSSTDTDPILQPGLMHMGSNHRVAGAESSPFADGSFDAIATEPPFNEELGISWLLAALAEFKRLLAPRGRLAMMVGATQAEPVRGRARELGFHCHLDYPVDRKGTETIVLAFSPVHASDPQATS